MTFEEYFKEWNNVIDKTELYKVTNKLSEYYKRNLICPKQKDVFKAFELCSYKDVKIVFIGQDPYPQKDVATGILFGNKKGTINLSPSLEMIKEAVINYEIPHGPIDFDITLESWAEQGILMLNSALTCEMNKTGSHTMLWRPFISKLLCNLSNSSPGLLYVLFGDQAQTFEPYINKRINTILKVHHPAYYARTHSKIPSDLFIRINEFIRYNYNTSICWYREL